VSDFYYGTWGDDDGRVWAVGQVWGSRKGVAFSDDFGRSWAAQDRPNKHDLLDVHGDGEGSVWAVGTVGTVLRASCEEGVWKRVRAGLEGRLISVYCRSASEIYVANGDGGIERTSDGGRSWVRVFKAPAALRAIRGRGDGPIYAVGAAWQVFRSHDGVSWTSIGPTQPVPANKLAQLDSVVVAPDGAVFIGGWQGTLMRSRDEGATWEDLGGVIAEPQFPVSALASNDGGLILAATFNTILGSRDSGDTWSQEFQNSDLNRHAWTYSLWLGAQGDAVAVGAHGTMRVRQR
jgi:photosystem II stability/assembly factor-like uncharacterized protein